MSSHPGVDSEKFFGKKYNEQLRIEKTLIQPPAERITNLTLGRPLMIDPVIDGKERKLLMALFKKGYGILVTELHQKPQIFYSKEVKICPLKTLK